MTIFDKEFIKDMVNAELQRFPRAIRTVQLTCYELHKKQFYAGAGRPANVYFGDLVFNNNMVVNKNPSVFAPSNPAVNTKVDPVLLFNGKIIETDGFAGTLENRLFDLFGFADSNSPWDINTSTMYGDANNISSPAQPIPVLDCAQMLLVQHTQLPSSLWVANPSFQWCPNYFHFFGYEMSF